MQCQLKTKVRVSNRQQKRIDKNQSKMNVTKLVAKGIKRHKKKKVKMKKIECIHELAKTTYFNKLRLQ